MKQKETDKRELILQKAEELFSKQGFKGTSTRMLAKAAGVNLGMLTYYFGSKDKILHALIDRKIGFYRDSFVMIEKLDLPAIKKVEAIIDMQVEHMIANRRFHRILQAEVLCDKPSANVDYAFSEIRKNHEFLMRIIEQGVKKKEFRSNVDCHMFLCAMKGTIMNIIKSEAWSAKWIAATYGDGIDSKKYIEHVKTFMKDLAHSYLLIQTKKKK